MARINGSLTRDGRDRFTIKQAVFQQSAYMELVPHLHMGKRIVFDEPSYALGKRDWFKELQKVLVHTLESQRFLVHPVFILIVNLALLDKTIKAYLVSHVAHAVGRGHAVVYKVIPSQRTGKVYWYMKGELYYHMFDSKLCSRSSCLGCKKLDDCQVFRAQYERKKRSIQLERYEQGKEESLKRESEDFTEKQLEDILEPVMDSLLTAKGLLNVSAMRMHLREQHGISISSWKAYNIKRNL